MTNGDLSACGRREGRTFKKMGRHLRECPAILVERRRTIISTKASRRPASDGTRRQEERSQQVKLRRGPSHRSSRRLAVLLVNLRREPCRAVYPPSIGKSPAARLISHQRQSAGQRLALGEQEGSLESKEGRWSCVSSSSRFPRGQRYPLIVKSMRHASARSPHQGGYNSQVYAGAGTAAAAQLRGFTISATSTDRSSETISRQDTKTS